ncbi:2,3-bisphosphoglycerate-independent phosphoglycerate mutase [Flavobacteriaceae bacterium TK19130]|nr:2,3-bisphosphoglycerate-independent phosphoglycerate mutase [Thermobacterium salinum]
MSKNVMLLILDGWGIPENPENSAIAAANTPYIDSLYNRFPNTQLLTHGENVGLPKGQMGNSEVGHMNLGAGRIVYQDLAKIDKAVGDGSLQQNEALQKAFGEAKNEGKKLHFIGLVSDGGVHSHIDHLKGLLSAASAEGLDNIYVHAFTDGRDVDPKSGVGHLQDLQQHLNKTKGKIATVIGRYYAMDRDQRWERVREAYELLVHGKGKDAEDIISAVEKSYENGVTDEFIKPIIHTENGKPIATIDSEDVVIFFNFRTDRGRQLTQVLSQKDFSKYGMKRLPLHFVTMTNYDDSFKGIDVLFKKEHLKNTLGEVLSQQGKTQIRIAETEKYPHVTFFFNGGREEPFEGEHRILCPSPKVATYDLQPEMSAYDVRDKIVPELKQQSANFICLNFANPDMVGHTGVFEAAVKACETVDMCTKQIVDTAMENDYAVLVLADHGNCEKMRNKDGSPNTAHTTNPVPLIVVDNNIKSVKKGILGDIAPTILHLMEIDQPEEMTQHSLI